MAKDTTHSPISTAKTQPTIKERLASATTGYLSIPSSFPQAIKDGLLKRARKKFPHLRIGSFQSEFENSRDWRKNLVEFLAGVDVLIVAVDSTRLAGAGIRHEIERARAAGKLIVLFDAATNRYSRYYGYDALSDSTKAPAIKLRDRAMSAQTQEKAK